MSYHYNTIYDFVMDGSFKRAVKAPESESGKYWETYYSLNSAKRGIMNEARQIIQLLDFEKDYLSNNEIKFLKKELDRKIERSEHSILPDMPPRKFTYYLFGFWYKVAAVFIGLTIVSALLIFMLQYQMTTKYKYK